MSVLHDSSIIFVDRDGIAFKVVDYGARAEGFPAEFEGKRWFDLVEDSSRDAALDAHRACLSGRSLELSADFPGLPSPFRQLRLQIAGCPDSSGRIDSLVIHAAPILPAAIERKPNDLVEKELPCIYENDRFGTCLIDRDFKVLRITSSLARLQGLSVAESTGRSFLEMLGDLAGEVEPRIKHVFSSGAAARVFPIGTMGPHCGDKPVFRDISLSPIKGDDGSVEFISIRVHEDIESVDWEKVRLIAEERTLQLVESCNSGVCFASEDLNISFANKKLHEILGYEPGELNGKTLHSLVHGRHASEFLERIEQRLDGFDKPRELALRKKNGDALWVNKSAFLVKKLTEDDVETICLMFVDITARKTVELELARSEERHRIATKLARLGHFEWNLATNAVHWSPELHRILEVEDTPDVDRHGGYRSRVDPRDREFMLNLVQNAIRNRTDYRITYRLLLASGKTKYVEEYGTTRIQQTPTGSHVVLYGTIQDVTLARQSQSLLEENEKRFRLALEAGRMETWDLDWASRELTLSKHIWELLRIEPEAVPRRTLSKILRLFVIQDRKKFLRAILRSVRSGKPQELEVRLKSEIRKSQSFMVLWTVRFDPTTRRAVRIIGVIRDISAAKEKERQKAAAETNLSRVLETALEGVWVVNQKRKTTLINTSLSRILGYTANELMGRSYLRFVKRESRADAIEFFKRCSKGNGGIADLCFAHKTGAEVWAIVSCSPIRNAAGDFQGLFCLLTEITARKKMEEELLIANETAEKATRVKTQFLAHMSHELRTPISSILGYSEILQANSNAYHDTVFAIDGIKSNGEHLIKLIDDILDFSSITMDHFKIHPVPHDPAKLLAEVVAICGVRAEARGIRLNTEITSALPEVCDLDPTRLKQVLINLVNNAVKFSDSGRAVLLRLKAESTTQGPSLIFSVHDEGIGISPENQKLLFKAFSQVDDSMSRKHGGVGLGLSLSAKIAEAMRGKITVQSQLGMGSTFTLTIPLVNRSDSFFPDKTQPMLMETPSDNGSASATKSRETPKVLVVDDNPGLRRIMRYHLEQIGLSVIDCEGGNEALELIHLYKFSLVILDIQMPNLSGNEVVRSLRKSGFTMPVLALSAHVSATDRTLALRAGCTVYLTKPITRQNLLAAVRKHLKWEEPELAATGSTD